MSDFQIYILIGAGIYFLIMLFMGLHSSKNESDEGFVIGSRNVSLLPTIASISTSFRDGAGAVFWVGAGLGAAYGGLWMLVGFSLATIFFVLYAPKMRELAKEHDFITISQVIRHQLGPVTEKSISLIILTFSIAMITMQLFVSGNIFAKVLDIPSFYGIASVAVVVGTYMFFGGYSTVIKTDYLQFFIVISLVLFPFFVQPTRDDLLNFETFINVDKNFGFGVFFLGIFYILSGAETWQRVFSARSKQVVQWSFPLSAIFLTLMTLSLIWVGMGTKDMIMPVSENDALFKIFTLEGRIPSIILAYFAVVIIAITMSTLDSFCYLFSSTLSKNILPQRFTDTRKKYVGLSQFLIVFTLAISVVFALTITDFIEFIFSAASLNYILGPVYVLTATGFLKGGPRIDKYVTGSLAVSIVVYIYMFSQGMFSNLMYTGIPVLTMLTLLLLSYPLKKLLHKA